jgi:hypothetical protein
MAKLSSVNALRLMISAVVGVSVFLAITSEGRSEKLDQWLRSGSASLAPLDRQSLEDWIDLTGGFCTSGSEREFTLEGSWYADEEIQAGTDRDAAAAG